MGLIVPKRRFQPTLRRAVSQKIEEFTSAAAEACDHAYCEDPERSLY
jgi:hypothetical protein